MPPRIPLFRGFLFPAPRPNYAITLHRATFNSTSKPLQQQPGNGSGGSDSNNNESSSSSLPLNIPPSGGPSKLASALQNSIAEYTDTTNSIPPQQQQEHQNSYYNDYPPPQQQYQAATPYPGQYQPQGQGPYQYQQQTPQSSFPPSTNQAYTYAKQYSAAYTPQPFNSSPLGRYGTGMNGGNGGGYEGTLGGYNPPNNAPNTNTGSNTGPLTDTDTEELYRTQRRFRSGEMYTPKDLSFEAFKQSRRRRAPAKDAFDVLGLNPLNEYKNFNLLSEYTTDMGRIKHRSETGLRPVNQRKISKAIRRAVGIGLLPSTHKHPELLKKMEEMYYGKLRLAARGGFR